MQTRKIRRPVSLAIALTVLCLAPTLARAENWPGWRGPRGDGSSEEKGLPTAWSETENIAWKEAIPGVGHTSPIIWQDRIFVTTCIESEQRRVLLCLDRRTGKTLWEKT